MILTLLFGVCIGATAALLICVLTAAGRTDRWLENHKPTDPCADDKTASKREGCLPCRACGSLPVILGVVGKWSLYHDCNVTGMYCELRDYFSSQQELISAWNNAISTANKPGDVSTILNVARPRSGVIYSVNKTQNT